MEKEEKKLKMKQEWQKEILTFMEALISMTKKHQDNFHKYERALREIDHPTFSPGGFTSEDSHPLIVNQEMILTRNKCKLPKYDSSLDNNVFRYFTDDQINQLISSVETDLFENPTLENLKIYGGLRESVEWRNKTNQHQKICGIKQETGPEPSRILTEKQIDYLDTAIYEGSKIGSKEIISNVMEKAFDEAKTVSFVGVSLKDLNLKNADFDNAFQISQVKDSFGYTQRIMRDKDHLSQSFGRHTIKLIIRGRGEENHTLNFTYFGNFQSLSAEIDSDHIIDEPTKVGNDLVDLRKKNE